MKISIFGLGYVGVTSAACLAEAGHEVVGVDLNMGKVDMINEGLAPIVEDKINDLIRKGVDAGRIRATTNPAEAVEATELALVCVGTPSQGDGSTQLGHVVAVARDIGASLRDRIENFTVVIRSTVPPGTTRRLVQPALEEASGRRAGIDFSLCMHPEFLREGTSVLDFFNPPKIVIGSLTAECAAPVQAMNDGLKAPLFVCDLEVAEMVKYVDNTWHALKVVFGNEIGRLAKSLGIDSHEVMSIFCQDTKLNISPKYLTPGFAFGGSCLPKDVRGIISFARRNNVRMPVIGSILDSNSDHIRRAFEMVTQFGRKPVGILGLSFKEGTDDLRESPIVDLVEQLIGKGYDIRIYDRNVNLSRLIGANRDYLLHHLPHIGELLLEDIDAVVRHAEVIVVANKDPCYVSSLMSNTHYNIIDLVRIDEELEKFDNYHGLLW